MKKYFSKRELIINNKRGFIKFKPTTAGFYFNGKQQWEIDAVEMSLPFHKGDIVIKSDDSAPVKQVPVEAKAEVPAEEIKLEQVKGVTKCTDAAAYLRKRFSQERVSLRSKNEILEYAASKNIEFPDLA